jgi:acetyl/propionyl-CoA carboxylase alpha subunit
MRILSAILALLGAKLFLWRRLTVNLGRVLVAERGPLAGYLIRSLKRLGLETVAVAPDPVEPVNYSQDADFFVQLLGGNEGFKEALIEVAMDSGCDAVHPGYGPLAEDAEFAQMLGAARIGFVGPQPEIIGALASRWTVREMAVQAGIPVVSGCMPLEGPEDIRKEVGRLGLPLWVKDGTGQRPVLLDTLELVEQVAGIRLSSQEEPVWLEQHIQGARHLVVSFVADVHGELVTLGVRERAIRLDGHLILDQAPAPVSKALAKAVAHAAHTYAGALGYVGLGSVGFLVDPNESLWCLGFRSRLQVGNLLTDRVQGLNLAELQLRLAAQEEIGWNEADLEPKGCALGLRIRARQGGVVQKIVVPPEVSFETHLCEGSRATGLLGILLVEAPTRQACVVKAVTSLESFSIEGVDCGLDEHLQSLTGMRFWKGEAPGPKA